MPSDINYKYKEGALLDELKSYVDKTYDPAENHYVGSDNVQAMDLIIASGHGIGFVVGDIIKYASRYGKKKGQERKDILKILHYALFLLFLHDKNAAAGVAVIEPHSGYPKEFTVELSPELDRLLRAHGADVAETRAAVNNILMPETTLGIEFPTTKKKAI